MKLRHKLLLAQAPVALALLLVVGASYGVAEHLGRAPSDILYENFRSFDAARSMQQAANAIDERVTDASFAGRAPEPDAFAEELATVERELALQQSNITEPGELEATSRLREAWDAYRETVTTAERVDWSALRSASRTLRDRIDEIFQINRGAMTAKSDEVRAEAANLRIGLVLVTFVSMAIAILTTGLWTRRLLSPLRVVEGAVQRLSEGDFEARIRLQGTDEVASLAASFNDMAAKLREYRASSLGELLEANNRLMSVMDSLADAVVVYDLAGMPQECNRVAFDLLGRHHLELEALPEALRDAVVQAFEAVRRDGEPHVTVSLDAAVELATTPGARFLLVGATPVLAAGGALLGVTVALRDVTKARRIDGFRGDLVAAAAHELRTPLTSLQMAVHLCLEQAAGPLTDRQTDLLHAARTDCQRIQTVIDELLEMARLESGAVRLSRTRVPVEDLVRDALSRHDAEARATGTELAIVPSDRLCEVEADAERLRHVFGNLIDNAIKYAGDHGPIRVGWEPAEDAVKIFVDDEGPGVPPGERERIFAKFYRAPGSQRSGSGLGLSIAQDIVRAHGGHLGVTDAPRGGARFWFTVPIAGLRQT